MNRVNLFTDYSLKFADLPRNKQALVKQQIPVDLLFELAMMDTL
jgi:hypothetical protein